jgi:hypothetical protein
VPSLQTLAAEEEGWHGGFSTAVFGMTCWPARFCDYWFFAKLSFNDIE